MNQRNFVHTHNSEKTMIKCFMCNQDEHMPSKCPLKGCNSSPHKRYQTTGCLQWIKKVNKCDLALTAQDLKSQWYLDSGYSKHMTGDKRKFIILDEKKYGNVTFGNDKSGKIKGKGSVSIENGRGKAQDVLFVD